MVITLQPLRVEKKTNADLESSNYLSFYAKTKTFENFYKHIEKPILTIKFEIFTDFCRQDLGVFLRFHEMKMNRSGHYSGQARNQSYK